ncbi:MAG: polyprenyl synthetase family protein [Bacteroidaceae bacterium]|nr:polyprenyl synthetase family protein [Bacteroidaceae bacterium]
MYNWEEVRDLINDFIENLQFEREPRELYAPIRYTLSQSGKRVRPVLFVMAYNMYKECVKETLYPAVAMETYHNYTLIHDDVMDRATIRRGKPTVCAKWGDTAAILSGDTMLVLAYEFFSHVPAEKLPSMLALFTETAKQIGDGQQYDLEFENRDNVPEAEYLEMIRLKTSVLLAASLKLGGMLAGASETDLENLYAYGETMGLAFQLQDDLLDVYADQSLFGKKIGGDICCNKKTFLLITAMNLASEKQLAEMKAWMEREEFDAEEKIAFFTNIYNELGVKEICEKRIEELFAKCDDYIGNISVSEDKKVNLKNFANSLLNRKL